MHLTIKGEPPALKNNKRIVINRSTGKPMVISSVRYKQWEQDALWQLKGKRAHDSYPLGITMLFYLKSLRRKDLTNLAQGVEDVLVKAGILLDDSFRELNDIRLLYAGQDKLNPRVEILFGKVP